MSCDTSKKKKELLLSDNEDMLNLKNCRDLSGDCIECYGIGGLVLFCNKHNDHKGWHSFKTDTLEIKWK